MHTQTRTYFGTPIFSKDWDIFSYGDWICLKNNNVDLKKKYGTVKNYLENHGKWVVYGRFWEIWEIVEKIIKDDISKLPVGAMKLSRVPARETEIPCKLERPYVFVIYCDKREKEDVKNFLENNFKNREFCWYYKLDLKTLYQALEKGNEKGLKNFYKYWDLRAEEGKRIILETMKRLNLEP